jgi:hypothetical protein
MAKDHRRLAEEVAQGVLLDDPSSRRDNRARGSGYGGEFATLAELA